MIIVPVNSREDVLLLVNFLDEKHIPHVVEDINPYLVWIVSVPCDPGIEYQWTRSLLESAGLDCDGYSEQTLSALQEICHNNAVSDKCRFVENPKKWDKIVNRLPTGIPPIDIV